MTRVEESVEPLALPEQTDVHTPTEVTGQALEGVDGDAIRVATLQPVDDRPRHTSPIRKLCLHQASAHSKCPEPETEPDDVHPPSVACADALGRIRGVSAS